MSDEGIAADIAAVARIDAIPSILEIACRITGLRFAAVARVTETRWAACAVRDEIAFGLEPGGELDIKTTICNEIRESNKGVIIDHVTRDDGFCDHPTPRAYGFESYISIPIFRRNGEFFGTLCALDPLPAKLSQQGIVATFENFAQLIGLQLDAQEVSMRQQAALDNAGETAEIRERFIAILGHDLRNPVAAIDAGTNLLGRMDLGSRATNILVRMKQSSHRMSELIGDLLDFARGRLGDGLPLNRKTISNLAGPIEEVVAELQMVHPDQRIDLEIRLAEAVTCDIERIAQLLSNLLGNALTHGAADAPIKVNASSKDGRFTMAVTNGGPSIPAAAMATLFQPFTQARPGDSSRTQASQGRTSQGLGLGLFIASEIAKAHYGSISVKSGEGCTCFTFTMPCTANADVADAQATGDSQKMAVSG